MKQNLMIIILWPDPGRWSLGHLKMKGLLPIALGGKACNWFRKLYKQYMELI